MSVQRVLIVEDEGLVAADIVEALEEMGYAVAGTAATGEDAVRKTREARPDVVLMDVRLAGDMDGIDAARVIRRELDLPVVFLTAHSDEATVRRATATLPFGYLVKPFEPADLRVALEVTRQRVEGDRTLRAQEALLRTVLAHAHVAMLGVDDALRVAFMNQRAEVITGWSAAEAVGEPLARVLDVQVPGGGRPAADLVADAFEDGRSAWSLGVLAARDGSLTLVDGVAVRVTPTTPSRGRLAVVTIADRSSTAPVEDLVRERQGPEGAPEGPGG